MEEQIKELEQETIKLRAELNALIKFVLEQSAPGDVFKQERNQRIIEKEAGRWLKILTPRRPSVPGKPGHG
jgi:hypothetical protein